MKLLYAVDAMSPQDKEKIGELGDIALLLCGQVIGNRIKTEPVKEVLKEMEPYRERIELLLTELGL